jgi:sugar lactone lactonase YvrE
VARHPRSADQPRPGVGCRRVDAQGRASFLTAGEHGFAELGPGWTREYPVPYEQGKPDNLLNDGKADSRGRMWVGSRSRTHGSRDGRIHRLDPDGSITTFEGDFQIANGMGWSPDERTFYAVDSIDSLIYAYDFDLDAGTIAGRRVFAEIPYELGLPDGLAVDAEGGVWLALCFGGAVQRFAADGSLDLVIEMPVAAVTSVAFGGHDLSTLYITTGRLRDIPMVHERGLVPADHQPGAGDVYAYAAGVRGLPMHRWRPES